MVEASGGGAVLCKPSTVSGICGQWYYAAEVKAENKSKTVTIVNQQKTNTTTVPPTQNISGSSGTLTIAKMDEETNKLISGIQFRIEGSVYDSTEGKTINIDTTVTTGSDGKAQVSLHSFIPKSSNASGSFTVTECGSTNLYYEGNKNLAKPLQYTISYTHTQQWITWSWTDYQYYDCSHAYGHWEDLYDEETGEYIRSDYIIDGYNEYTTHCSRAIGWDSGETNYDSVADENLNSSLTPGADAGRRRYKSTRPCSETFSMRQIVFTNQKCYDLTINKRDPDLGCYVTADIAIRNDNDGTYLTDQKDEFGRAIYSREFTTIRISGTKSFSGVKRGSYSIYETKVEGEYNLKLQGSSYDELNKRAYLGSQYIGYTKGQYTWNIDNRQYVEIFGKVWEDQIVNAKSTTTRHNYIYDNMDELMNGMTVQLVENGVVRAQTVTEDGEYYFLKSSAYPNLVRSRMSNFEIRFVFDRTANYDSTDTSTYITVPLEWNGLSDSNSSKAIEDGGSNTGVAVSKLGRYRDTVSREDWSSIYNINCGLIRKPITEYALNECISYVKVVKGNYTYTYRYGESLVLSTATQPQVYPATVRYQNSRSTYTQKIYPCDIKYNVANGLNGNDNQAFKVYVVYRIDITNTETLAEQYVYQEKGLYLNSLTSTYDSNIYTLCNNENTEDSTDISLWSENNGVASYDIGSSNRIFKSGNSGIRSLQTESVYIQLKVKDEVLNKVGSNTNIGANSVAITTSSNAFHTFYRNDSNWTYSYTRQNVHRTYDDENETSALGIIWSLYQSKTISGNVFEDKQTTESANANTRVGNGKRDESESNIKDVIVSLVYAEDVIEGGRIIFNEGDIAKLYTEDLIYNNGVWSTVTKDAITKVDENGNYKFTGVAAGKYYLRFTYGNGETSYTDINGNIINIDTKDINNNSLKACYYKSTILNEEVTNTGLGDKWYILNSGKQNSVATDKTAIIYKPDGTKENISDIIDRRTTSEDEMNYSTQQEKEIITAQSPALLLEFENTTNNSFNMRSYNTEYSEELENAKDFVGLNFGIIERPYTDITLTKKINNVKITLQNGTNIINGNPANANVSQYLTNLDGTRATEGSNYVKIEKNLEDLYSAEVEIKYIITVTNNSEIDYATIDYYKQGILKPEDKVVTTTVTKLADYISVAACTYKNMSNNIENIDENYSLYKNSGYFDTDIGENNNRYAGAVVLTKDENLVPERAEKRDNEKSKTQYEITVSRLLDDNDSMGWESYSEIIGIKNKTHTMQYYSKLGNYKAGDRTLAPSGTHETDDDSSILAIVPATGAEKSNIKYVILTIYLIVLVGGIVLIKKKVL